MRKITKVRLPESMEEELAYFMAKEGIGLHDKNAVITRAVGLYLADRRGIGTDPELSSIVEERSRARSRKGKEIWQRSQA
jgi:hypothetical protein